MKELKTESSSKNILKKSQQKDLELVKIAQTLTEMGVSAKCLVPNPVANYVGVPLR
jgi:hypothetical protein